MTRPEGPQTPRTSPRPCRRLLGRRREADRTGDAGGQDLPGHRATFGVDAALGLGPFFDPPESVDGERGVGLEPANGKRGVRPELTVDALGIETEVGEHLLELDDCRTGAAVLQVGAWAR